ncbi:hypothetical protein Pcinc_036032 [Petrolisthes cinctipes]|uniref:Uncharacterized protein n=1 Tax=Petrolisthes cinctipes TaxID=88211 RepID=A0AAE1BYJ0_PETCI|nr:hypothetical protein Pcinc_036032 [Petrolisthes cinctipes]
MIYNAHMYTAPDSSHIDTKEHIRDLGITLSSDGNFTQHIHQVRRGRLCHIERIYPRANARIKTLKENAFSVRAPLIFNALPRYLRESTEHLDGFKNQLDKFLRTIPDQPKLPHYHLSAASNSIIDQLAQRRADGLY